MFKFLIQRIIQGGFVMVGSVVAVFFLFYVLPVDPARGLTGQHPSPETIAAIHADLGLDKPMSTQFLSYINDLSPISVHDINDKESPYYLDPDQYTPYIKLYSW